MKNVIGKKVKILDKDVDTQGKLKIKAKKGIIFGAS